VARPIVAVSARTKSVLELPVNSLLHTVGLRVEGGGVVVSDAEAIGELDHSWEENWAPLLVVRWSGAPNLETQLLTKASVQAAAVVDRRGIASSQRVERSMIVKI